MGWDNPPVPWREFERQLSWASGGNAGAGNGGDGAPATRPPRERDRGPGGAPAAGLSSAGPSSAGPSSAGLPWAELHCHSAYSFLDGASDPGGMYGVPQFAQAAARLRERTGVQLGTVFGAELSLDLAGGMSRTGVPDPPGRHLLVLARDPEGYRRLCEAISAAHLAGGEKGRPVYDLQALAAAHGGHWVILTGCRKGAVPAALARESGRARAGGPARESGRARAGGPARESGRARAGGPARESDPPRRQARVPGQAELRDLVSLFGRENVFVELIDHDQPGDDERNDALFSLAIREGLGVVATS